MILLDHVTKRYGTKTAVEDLTLDVPAGELFAFLGPNGAGKTTTIKMMCGLLFPTAGRVLIGGHDVQRDGGPARALLSYVPDQPFLYEHLTGREFLQFIADMYGLPPDLGRRRIAILNHGKLIGCGTLEALRSQAAVDGPLEQVFLTLTLPDSANDSEMTNDE
jgi:ABC-type multidrug transport system ATPase subunit